MISEELKGYYSQFYKRPDTFQTSFRTAFQIATDTKFLYLKDNPSRGRKSATLNAFYNNKPTNHKRQFINFQPENESMKATLNNCSFYGRLAQALLAIKSNTDMPEELKNNRWISTLNTHLVSGINSPDFSITEDNCGRLSTRWKNLQGLPKETRIQKVLTEVKHSLDYIAQHPNIARTQQKEKPLPEFWSELESITGEKKTDSKPAVTAFYFGQGESGYIGEELGINPVAKNKKERQTAVRKIVTNILKDKSHYLHDRALKLKESRRKTISGLKALHAIPEDRNSLMPTGSRIMNSIIPELQGEKILPIYDEFLTCSDTAKDKLLEVSAVKTKAETGYILPIRVGTF